MAHLHRQLEDVGIMCHHQGKTQECEQRLLRQEIIEAEQRWWYNITTIKLPKASGLRATCPNWHVMVNKYTEMKVSAFFPLNNATVKTCASTYNRQQDAGCWSNISGKITPARI
jgi:hypothetical protein